MVVGKAGVPPTGLIGQVVPEETVRVYGYQLRTDVRIGVVPGPCEGLSFDRRNR